MKKTSNILSIILFIILLPFTFVANIIADFLDAWKVKTDLPEPEKKQDIKISNTVYPDKPTKDLNEWYQYIDKQLN